MDLAALAAGGVGSLFGYNRENYFFDGKQRIKRIYQGQTMRVKQFELFREDIRDLMNLTVAKMDNYLIVNTIQIGLVVVLFTEGRPKPGDAPPWLLFLWGASGVGSFMYIALCIWLAMHASICSHSYCVRILTQLVRLPIPTKEQLDAARVLATDFEGAEVREMLRFPVVKQQLKKLKTMVEQMEEEQLTEEATYGSDAASDPGEETMLDASGRPVQSDTLAHVKLYRRMQANWQAYDAYARVCMAMGTNQFLQQLGYTCLIGFISENHSVLPGICSVVIFSVCAALLVRLDLYLPLQHLVLAGILNTLPPMIAGVSLILNMLTLDGKSAYWKLLGDSLVPAAFFLHILWLGLLLVWAKGKVINNIYLPTIFRAVLYLDVFGWLSSEDRQESRTLTGAAEDENTADSFSGLSVVQEEEPSQPSRLRIPGSDGRRQSLRDSLAKLCGEMKSDLEKDLKCFEAEDVSSIMEPYEKQAIQDLRQQLNDTVASVRLEEPGEATDESKPVWVRLEWNPSGRASYFYRQVRPEDPKVVWTRPLPPDQVLELEELRTRLEGLKKKVEMLASHFQDEQVTISFDASSCRSSNNSGEAEQLSHWPESASAGESHPTQDQTQAASEAVQLAESAAAMQAQAGAGFHPHQPRADTRPGPDRHQEPGLLPWTTVKQGSLILISAWGIGLVWSILRLWTDVVDILDPPKKPDNPDLELLFDGPWPRYFQPRGLACDERDRDKAPRILIAEKHEVHQLLQEEHWTLSTSSMEAACLSTQPRFHASGLRGISLQCAHEGCESVLVGEGSRALRCGSNETAELKLHGGPWHLATSLDQGVWATRPAESSPVLLHPGSDGWVPALQLAEHPAASDQRLLDRLQDGGLLAMSHAGRIHAWQPQASSSSWLPSGWSYDLPADLGLSWTGLCTAGSSLILLGQAAGKVEVWRLSLPALRGA